MIDDLATTIGIPDNSALMIAESKIREQKAIDGMILDEKDRSKAHNLISEKGDELLVRRSLSTKDELLIKKMNFLSDTIKIEKPLEPVPDFTKVYNPEELRFQDNQKTINAMNKEELHVENLVKILYLNNANPQEYDLEFWAKTLNINTQKLKNIFYNFSYFVIEDNIVIGKLTFIDIPKKKEIFDAFQESIKREYQKDKL